MAPFQAGGWRLVCPVLPLPSSRWVGAPEAGEEGVHPCCCLPARPRRGGDQQLQVWQGSEAIVCTQKDYLGALCHEGVPGYETISQRHLSQWWGGEGGTQLQHTDLCSNLLSILVLSFKCLSPCRVWREPGSTTGSPLLQLGIKLLPLLACEHPLSTQNHPNGVLVISCQRHLFLPKKRDLFSEYLVLVIISREKVWFWGTKCSFPATFCWLLEVSACQS